MTEIKYNSHYSEESKTMNLVLQCIIVSGKMVNGNCSRAPLFRTLAIKDTN